MTTPAKTDDSEIEFEKRATDRVVTFEDAVIAIAITILALDLPVPKGTDASGADLTSIGYFDAIGRNWLAYLAFFISFQVIATQWANHRRIFRYVSGLNNRLVQLNITWLMLMILVPFATKMITGDGPDGPRFTVYALLLIAAVGCLMLMEREVHVSHLLSSDAPASARHLDLVPSMATLIVFVASIPVAWAVGDFAFWLWALSPRVGHLIRRFDLSQRLTADDA